MSGAPDPLARPLWRGRTNVDAITIAAIEYAESLRPGGEEFVVTQGSYQGGSGDPNSGTTHDLGGVVDLRWTGERRDIKALRRAGFAAWHRTPAQGPWVDHIHAVLVDHPLLAQSAAKQVSAYRTGRNGLLNNGPDDGPRIRPIPVFEWPPKDWFDMASEEDLQKIVRDEVAPVLRILGNLRDREKTRHDEVRNRLRALEKDARDDATQAQVRDIIDLLDGQDAEE